MHTPFYSALQGPWVQLCAGQGGANDAAARKLHCVCVWHHSTCNTLCLGKHDICQDNNFSKTTCSVWLQRGNHATPSWHDIHVTQTFVSPEAAMNAVPALQSVLALLLASNTCTAEVMTMTSPPHTLRRGARCAHAGAHYTCVGPVHTVRSAQSLFVLVCAQTLSAGHTGALRTVQCVFGYQQADNMRDLWHTYRQVHSCAFKGVQACVVEGLLLLKQHASYDRGR